MKKPARNKKQTDELKQPEPSIEDHSDDYYTVRRMSLVDRTQFGDERIGDEALTENSLIEFSTLSWMVGRTVGAITRDDSPAATIWTPADELSKILLLIRQGIEANTEESRQDALAVIDAAVELAFLHTPAYRAALKLFDIGNRGLMVSDDETNAFDVIRGHITKAVKEESESELKWQ